MFDDFYSAEDYTFPKFNYGREDLIGDWSGIGYTPGDTGTTGDVTEHVFDPTYGGTSPVVPAGSVFEGMVPGGLTDQGIPTTAAELAAVNSVSAPQIWDKLKSLGAGAIDFLKENPGLVKALAAAAGMALGAADKAPPSGGGVAKRYVGPSKPLTRIVTQGQYGPIARYAAQGGIMHAYRNGGQVRPFAMQDGGFVMTKRAVDGAGGPQGIRQLVPGARMIGGPPDPTGTRDRTPAYIQGPNGNTPARVSRGEAYVPPGQHDTRGLYALMKRLERRA